METLYANATTCLDGKKVTESHFGLADSFGIKDSGKMISGTVREKNSTAMAAFNTKENL